MIAQKTIGFLDSSSISIIMLPALDKCNKFEFIPNDLVQPAKDCLKALVVNICGIKHQVGKGIFLFAWHVKSFLSI
jgi:hypothetical protein